MPSRVCELLILMARGLLLGLVRESCGMLGIIRGDGGRVTVDDDGEEGLNVVGVLVFDIDNGGTKVDGGFVACPKLLRSANDGDIIS